MLYYHPNFFGWASFGYLLLSLSLLGVLPSARNLEPSPLSDILLVFYGICTHLQIQLPPPLPIHRYSGKGGGEAGRAGKGRKGEQSRGFARGNTCGISLFGLSIIVGKRHGRILGSAELRKNNNLSLSLFCRLGMGGKPSF